MIWLNWLLLFMIIALPFFLLVLILQYRAQLKTEQALISWARKIGIDESVFLKELKLAFPRRDWRTWSWVQRLTDALRLAGFYQPAYLKAYIQFQIVAVLAGIWFILMGGVTMILPGISVMFVPYMVLKILQVRFARKLSAQFPQMLESLVRILHTGHSIDSAIGQLVETVPDPLRYNLQQLSNQLQVGASFKDALLRFQALTPVPEANFFVGVLVIQRETGGAIVPILSRLASMLRRREVFQGKVRVITSETRFTANFLILAPTLYILYKFFFDPVSMHFFLQDPTGKMLFFIAIGLVAVGILIINRMMRISL